MNTELLMAINAVVADACSLSKEEAQSKFDESQNGVISRFFLDAKEFSDYLIENNTSSYTFVIANVDVADYIYASEKIQEDYICMMPDFSIRAVNDEYYMLAA